MVLVFFSAKHSKTFLLTARSGGKKCVYERLKRPIISSKMFIFRKSCKLKKLVSITTLMKTAHYQELLKQHTALLRLIGAKRKDKHPGDK